MRYLELIICMTKTNSLGGGKSLQPSGCTAVQFPRIVVNTDFRSHARARGIAAGIRSPHVPPMTQHSIRQAKRDELAFPVRLKIRVPDNGLGPMLDKMMAWLRANAPAVDFACHSAPGLACSTAAFYFRNLETAHSFVSAFPAAELADGIMSPAYSTARSR